MRKVIVVSLAVLVIAFMPVLASANAPIFVDVPGMITVTPNGTGDYEYLNAFGSSLDNSVYDPDTADADLSWTFEEAVGGEGIITVNTKGPGEELRTDANTTFDVTDTSKGTSNTAGIVPADYTGTNAEAAIASAGTATKITVQCSDGTHQTEKEILIVSQATGAVNANNGISDPVEGYSYSTGPSYVGWIADTVVKIGTPADIVFTSVPGGMQAASTVNDPGTPTFDEAIVAGMISPGFNELGASAVKLQKGKMYRMRTTVSAADVSASTNADNMKFRMRCGAINQQGFDLQAVYVNQGFRSTAGLNSAGNKSPWRNPDNSRTGTYDNIFVSPQEARFEGVGYGGTNPAQRNFKMFFDVTDFDDYYYEGSLTFGQIEVEELDRPEVGSNGYLQAWGAGATAFNDPHTPQGSGATAAAGARGWNYNATNYTVFDYTGIATRHQDLTPGSGITDNMTTATFNSKTGGTELGMFCAATGLNFVTWEIGKPNGSFGAGAYPFNESSAVSYADVIKPLSDLVYYRCTYTITDSDGNALNNPQLRLRFGNGFNCTGNHLIIQGGVGSASQGRAAPSLDATVYEVWWKGPSDSLAEVAGGWQAGNNMEIAIDVLDDSNSTGDTYTITDVRIEAFPVNYFDN
jgi:hypothetical protein